MRLARSLRETVRGLAVASLTLTCHPELDSGSHANGTTLEKQNHENHFPRTASPS